jgi:hypothetical protein
MMDLEQERTALKDALATGAWGAAEVIARKLFEHTAHQKDFNRLILALRGLRRYDLIDDLAAASSLLPPEVHSMLGVRNARDKLDVWQTLRRAELHAQRFGLADEALRDELDAFCLALKIRPDDMARLAGGDALALALPSYGRSATPRTPPSAQSWLPEAEDLVRRRDLKGARELFFENYDWANTSWRVGRAASFFFTQYADGKFLKRHLRMAPAFNGCRDPEALDLCAGWLFRLGRSGEAARLLGGGGPTHKLEMYRILAKADLDLDDDALPVAAGENPADAPYRAALELRRAAVAAWPARPFVKTGRRRRFAVCISGQLRGWRRAMPPLLRAFHEQGPTDVFVSTWEDPGALPAAWHQANRAFSKRAAAVLEPALRDGARLGELLPGLRPLSAEQLELELRQELKPTSVNIEPAAPFEAVVRRKFADLRPEYLNQFKMFYKIHDAWRLLDQHMQKHGAEYDFVVRVRPDRAIAALGFEEIYRRIGAGHVVGGHSMIEEGFDDGFAIGRPAAMARHAGVWPRMLAARTHRYLPTIGRDMKEELMLAHLFAEGIRPIHLKEGKVAPFVFLNVTYSDEEVAEALKSAAACTPLSEVQLRLAEAVGGQGAARGDG